MNYLAAVLLYVVKDEVQSFWCLFSLLFKRNWRMIFDDNTPKLMNLLQHLLSQDISLAAAFSPVFITLFVYQVPLPIASKIVECFILDGEIALVKILLRMLYVKRETIMRLQECELLSYLRSGMTSECCTEMEIG
jgi:Rab-GTPase-TBC domain